MPRKKKDHPMPVSFADFEASCREHGYITRVANCDTYYVMYTRNGIKTEVKPRWYTLGYGRSSEDFDVLERELRSWSRRGRRENVGSGRAVRSVGEIWSVGGAQQCVGVGAA